MNALSSCVAVRRSVASRQYLEASVIHNGPEQTTPFYYETALCNVRRWLRDNCTYECKVDVAILVGILAPPRCYSPRKSLEDEEKAVYYRELLCRSAIKKLKKFVVACRLTGSNAEGLTIVGDEDYMWIATNIVGDAVPTQFTGYYHIKKSRRMPVDNEEFVPNDKIKNWLFVLNDTPAHIHGPAVTYEARISQQSEDNVMALQWNKWPSDIDRQQFTTSLSQKLQSFVKASVVDDICATTFCSSLSPIGSEGRL
jgi:hypothetical protein